MLKMPTDSAHPLAHGFVVAALVFGACVFVDHEASAQGRDPLWNGAVIGTASGAAIGVAFTHAVRDSDLTSSQYAYGAVVVGALGARAGLAVDALLSRHFTVSRANRRRILAPPKIWRDVAAVSAWWSWR